MEQLKVDSRKLDLRLRQAIAARALEVATVDAERRRDGRRFAKQVIDISAALDGTLDEAAQSSYLLWEEGMTSVLKTVKYSELRRCIELTSRRRNVWGFVHYLLDRVFHRSRWS